MKIQLWRFFIFLWKPHNAPLCLIWVSSFMGQKNPFDLKKKKKIILIYSEKEFMLLLGVSELKIHRESKRNSIFTGMLTFDLFSSTECKQTHYWEPFYILLHLIIGCGCLIVYLEGSASVIDLLPDIPTLICPVLM